MIELVWLEQGGPRVERGTSTGFGTTLADRVVRFDLDGSVEMNFEQSGIRCVLSFALTTDASPEELPGSAVRPG